MGSQSPRTRLLLLLLSSATIVACSGDARQNITAPTSGALVKFFNFGVNSPAVNFYANTQKITAISSANCQPPNDTTSVCRSTGNESTVGTAYNAAGNGALYNQLPAGTYSLMGKISAATDKDLAVATVSTTLAEGKFYSYYVSGIYDATGKKADAFIVEDPLPTVDFSQTYVRFVNTVSNSQPMTLFAKDQVSGAETALGTAVAYKSAGAFIALPAGLYDLNTRGSGSTTNVITQLSVSFVAGHIYTVAARGDLTATVTANKGALSNNANR